MRNLAGDKDCDVKIRGELDEAGIPRVNLSEPSSGEVPASVVGKLGPSRLERAWYYWVVKGPVPLHVAEEMYATEVGKRDVRIGGHCGCPAPGEYGARYCVELYHIDSQEGLNLFAETMRRHGLVGKEAA